jgi:hypothetical protein
VNPVVGSGRIPGQGSVALESIAVLKVAGATLTATTRREEVGVVKFLVSVVTRMPRVPALGVPMFYFHLTVIRSNAAQTIAA